MFLPLTIGFLYGWGSLFVLGKCAVTALTVRSQQQRVTNLIQRIERIRNTQTTPNFLSQQLDSLLFYLQHDFETSGKLSELEDAMLKQEPLEVLERMALLRPKALTAMEQQLQEFEQLAPMVAMSELMTTFQDMKQPPSSTVTPSDTAAAAATSTPSTSAPAKPSTISSTSSPKKVPSSIVLANLRRQQQFNNETVVDVCIVGAGLGGLCAGAILNTLYGKQVAIFESHYLAGGCAHAFPRQVGDYQFVMDSGPTILTGCSGSSRVNALQQVLHAINQTVEWIPYHSWGMIESPGTSNELRWSVPLGKENMIQGPILQFGGTAAVEEYKALQELTKPLTVGAELPAMAMRPGKSALLPLLRYLSTTTKLLSQPMDLLTGTFAPCMDGPLFTVRSPWLRNWLDALAFSLSGLPANRTAAAAMAVILQDMETSQLDYPVGGMGSIVDALVRGVEQGSAGSKVHLRSPVKSIDCNDIASRFVGVTLENGKHIRARQGVICNAPLWSLAELIRDPRALRKLNNNQIYNPPASSESTSTLPRRRTSWANNRIVDHRDSTATIDTESLLQKCETMEMTGSFMHLHLALNASGLDLAALEAHYTVMDRGLGGHNSTDGPTGILNMIAVSNPCRLDPTLAPPGTIVVHAYGAANEPYDIWEGMDRKSTEYRILKQKRSEPLWRAVESIIPDARERVLLELIGSPLTHERFLRRPGGTYGSATEDYLPNGLTNFESLVLANDGVFPGIGVPAVAIAGASAAHAFVSIGEQWSVLNKLERKR
jgi:phytoene dehydrogenase-like protein